MNKQELSAKIWSSANKMRSKIDANEYKDYILGFIFYKFLSDSEEALLRSEGETEENIKNLTEENTEYVKYIKDRLGYFIPYKHFYSTWFKEKNDFDISRVRAALSSFNRMIDKNKEDVFKGIFDTLQAGLSKLGENSTSQTSAIWDLIYLIKDIPMDGKQNYDILGYIYEDLISNFAANAGKKAGEFYTPHEVSVLMSDIIAEHLKDRENIDIYDPTSGSGSLLINIGKSASKYIKNENGIKYYAQELNQSTYNLTRMNLIMRGILSSNIKTRNGDTLEEDWPTDELNPGETLLVDAVVSNPPYSIAWNPENREMDPRYKNYGVAPKSKADYAFLLHELYHIKEDGIMTIVLPHGVLFRGGDEAKIRKNLIEKNNIDVIIGLPSNIFFGTGIPTIIMILKKNKTNTDIQIIDASKGFIKEGKNNKLRTSDIKRIVDAVIERKDINKFSRVVSKDEIRENEYNLNIPRYVDSSDEEETYDLYSSMFGGIPKTELDKYEDFFEDFPNLKKDLFKEENPEYFRVEEKNINEYIKNHEDVKKYLKSFSSTVKTMDNYLENELLKDIKNINIIKTKEKISDEIFKKIDDFKLIDNYNAYQILDDNYQEITNDLETIEQEGLEACNKVDPNMVVKKKGGKDIEIQSGWKGRIFPFELVQKIEMKEQLAKITEKKNRLEDISNEFNEILENLTDEDKLDMEECLNETNDAFINKNIIQKAKEINKEKREKKIKIDEESAEYKILKTNKLINEQKELEKEIKALDAELQNETKEIIEKLDQDKVYNLLKEKWIEPIISNLKTLADDLTDDFANKIEKLAKKYDETIIDLEKKIHKEEKELAEMIDDLVGNEYDMKGLSEFKSLLLGEIYD